MSEHKQKARAGDRGLFFWTEGGTLMCRAIDFSPGPSRSAGLLKIEERGCARLTLALKDPYEDGPGCGERVALVCGWYGGRFFVDDDGNLCLLDKYEVFDWTRHVGKMLLV
jgi:hypothetical protein